MTLPSILLGFVISTLLGSAFHFWRGGTLGHLLLYLFLAWIGFWVGHFIADRTGWILGSVGTLHLVLACIGALITLLIGNWLFRVEKFET